MLILLNSKATSDQIQQAGEDLDGYIKFVVDLDRKIMTIGGRMHVEGEKLLMENGSKQADLWGGGFDLETKGLDFDSMINIRPNQGNTSREVLSTEVRQKMEAVVKDLVYE